MSNSDDDGNDDYNSYDYLPVWTIVYDKEMITIVNDK
jgi:hypothetical protein